MAKRKTTKKAQSGIKDGCDIKFLAKDATPDHELPVAVGGVQTVGREELDGCDIPMDVDITPDEQLPAAEGGIA